MTRQSSFKRLVRARMEKTGESYTAARSQLLSGAESGTSEKLRLRTSDEEIRRRTGRGWEEWFDLLDEWGAAERSHREAARWVAEQQSHPPLAWNVQAVVGGYELARGRRVVGEFSDGFRVSVSKTVEVPVETLYDAFVEPALRERWLPGQALRERTATRARSARFDWGEDGSRLHVTFLPKGEKRSTVAIRHIRLADATEAAQVKALWRDRVAALKEELER